MIPKKKVGAILHHLCNSSIYIEATSDELSRHHIHVRKWSLVYSGSQYSKCQRFHSDLSFSRPTHMPFFSLGHISRASNKCQLTLLVLISFHALIRPRLFYIFWTSGPNCWLSTNLSDSNADGPIDWQSLKRCLRIQTQWVSAE